MYPFRSSASSPSAITIDSVTKFHQSDDPLSAEAFKYLIEFREEHDQIDYKLTFDSQAEEQWFGITKDVSAFANTIGGYLIFGVEDGSFEPKGVPPELVTILVNVNNVQQKLNRYLEPDISKLRSKLHKLNDNSYVIWHIPQSLEVTHVIKTQGAYRQRSGKDTAIIGEYFSRLKSHHRM